MKKAITTAIKPSVLNPNIFVGLPEETQNIIKKILRPFNIIGGINKAKRPVKRAQIEEKSIL